MKLCLQQPLATQDSRNRSSEVVSRYAAAIGEPTTIYYLICRIGSGHLEVDQMSSSE